ncbi:hypothetical protein E5N72_08660 [Pseudoalteromonas sp. MEBiC 03607]|uniref:hypothetical protein n=1 Tax=unclassified Pseudoalteromonas TaxID=194690 RepID=UPI001093F685|nr:MULTISPECIES: hypothetical protein [unclassified Pseudoalteromonas]MCG7571262.1 hypothetical protein [Pseudoalteromonas sp. CNC9-20]TGV20141.1 hypothetical protein E5N72_08660 [Pseudoalteromonas sp. MEBiC 03607]
MIDQTHLVQDILVGDETVIEDCEIYNMTHVGHVDKWFATNADTAVEWLIDKKPAIISHFGCWVGISE